MNGGTSKQRVLNTWRIGSLHRYRKAYPTYSEPQEISHFSIDKTRTIHNNDSQLKMLDCSTSNIGCNLAAGFSAEGFKKNVPRNENLDNMMQHLLCSTSNSNSKPNASNKHHKISADFVTYRGMLTKIMCTPYDKYSGWTMNIMKNEGTIFIANYTSLEAFEEESGKTEQQRKMMYSGYRFEQVFTMDRKTSKPKSGVSDTHKEIQHQQGENQHLSRGENTPDDSGDHMGTKNLDKPADPNEEYCTVFVSRLAGYKLLMGAEVDCITDVMPKHHPNRLYVELKTSKEILTEKDQFSFDRYKLLKYWAQSYLAGIPRILVGFRDANLMLSKTEFINTLDIPKMIGNNPRMWDARVCLNFAVEVLGWIKHEIVVDDPYAVYRMEYKPVDNAISITKIDDYEPFMSKEYFGIFK